MAISCFIGAWPLHPLISRQLYIGIFEQHKKRMGDLEESPIGNWLPLLILVSSSLHVYMSLWVFLWRNRSMGFLGYCISHLWTGWNALNSPSLPNYTNVAAGVVLFTLLLQLRHSPARIALALSGGSHARLCIALSAGNLRSGLWLHYAKTLPLLMTLGSNFFTFMCYATISTIQVYWAFAQLRLLT